MNNNVNDDDDNDNDNDIDNDNRNMWPDHAPNGDNFAGQKQTCHQNQILITLCDRYKNVVMILDGT